MEPSQHAIILGAGIVGLFTALQLREHGVAVTVFEAAPEPARQSSWAGGGIISPLWPWETPLQVQCWAMAAHRLYPQWAQRLLDWTGIDIEYRRTGVIWHLDQASESERVADWHRRWQLPMTQPDALTVCSPALAQVRNPRLGRALALAAQRKGVTLHLDARVVPKTRNGRVVGVEAKEGVVHPADAVVVAAGAWAAALLQPLGVESDIQPVKGQMLLFAPHATAPSLHSVQISRDVYLIPRADGQIVVGSTVEHRGFDTAVTDVARQILHAAALRLWPGLKHYSIAQQWAGLRPGSTVLPQCGPTAVPGLWVHTGHFRNGITLAPATSAELVSQMFAGGIGDTRKSVPQHSAT